LISARGGNDEAMKRTLGSASLSPFGCRSSRIASTISGATHVNGRSRQTQASVTPFCSAMSVIDLAPPSIPRRRRYGVVIVRRGISPLNVLHPLLSNFRS
jgi:hypothetical protein